LAIEGLCKAFGKPAVDGLSLRVRPGELYALLGPNGAGKTTTLRMVAGLMKPDAGAITIFGVDALADPLGAKQIMAWAPDEPMLYDRLTPMEYLEFVAGLWGVPPATGLARAQALLEWLGLWDERNQRCEGFSRGMKQKTALAGALIHEPLAESYRDRQQRSHSGCDELVSATLLPSAHFHAAMMRPSG
jgi:ABC-2 type transport system ATP-binding protein